MSEMDQVYSRMNDDLELDVPTDEKSDIQEFYKDKTIFITGVTGFLGKCLVEKLLRSCPDLKHIYYMIRGKGKFSLEDRKKRFFSNVVFDNMRRMDPNFDEKVTAIEGDLGLEDLGLSENDRNMIINEVDIMFHNAANVKFDIKISLALKVNVLGTKYMLDLAKECKKLKIFMYISTAYSNCYNKHIEEKFYPSPATLDDVYDLIKRDTATEAGFSEKEVEEICGKFPNVYCFTKSIAEDLVRQYSLKDSNCAYGVYRPSIVMSAYQEPVPGFVDNKNGPVLVILGYGLGALHAAYNNENLPMDFIPSDYTINVLIALTRDCGIRWENERQPLIYNYGSTMVNRISFGKMKSFIGDAGWKEASVHCVWINFIGMYTNIWVFHILNIFFHFVPACLLDLYLLSQKKEAQAVPLFLKSIKHIDKIEYFGNGNWRIHMPNSINVIKQLNSADKRIFFCDLSDFSWENYIFIMWRGLKKYILNENLNSTAGTRRYAKLYFAHYSIISFIILIIIYFTLRLFSVI